MNVDFFNNPKFSLFRKRHKEIIDNIEKRNYSFKMIKDLLNNKSEGAMYCLEVILTDPQLDVELMHQIFDLDDFWILKYLLQNPNLPDDLIEKFFHIAHWDNIDPVASKIYKPKIDKASFISPALAFEAIIDYHKRKNDKTYFNEEYRSFRYSVKYELFKSLSLNKNLKVDYLKTFIDNFSSNNDIFIKNIINNNRNDLTDFIIYIVTSDNNINFDHKGSEPEIFDYIKNCSKESLYKIFTQCINIMHLPHFYIKAICMNVNVGLDIIDELITRPYYYEELCFCRILTERHINIILNYFETERLNGLNEKSINQSIINILNKCRLPNKKILEIIEKYIRNDKIVNSALKKLDNLSYDEIVKLESYNNSLIDLFIVKKYFNNKDERINQIATNILKKNNKDIIEFLSINSEDTVLLRNIAIRADDLQILINIILNENIDDITMYIISNLDLTTKLMKLTSDRANEAHKKIREFKNKLNDPYFKYIFDGIEPMACDALMDNITIRNNKSDTSLISITDDVVLDNDKIVIKPQNFELIKNQTENNSIIYGTYPLQRISNLESKTLDILFKLKKLTLIEKDYMFIYNGKIISAPLFYINNNKYLKVKENGKTIWIALTSLRWRIDDEKKQLVLIDNIGDIQNINGKNLNNFLNGSFKSNAFDNYKITPEEIELNKNLNDEIKAKDSKFKLIGKEKDKQMSIAKKEELIKNILKSLEEIKKSIEKMQEYNMIDFQIIKQKIDVPENVLIKKVDDHFEFNPEFIPYLKFIKLILIDSNNLKISNLDLRDTDLRVDPQLVYKKDLSNTKLSDNNITFGSFKGVNLCGADLSQELESINFIDAIIDENTKLPKKYNKNKSL